MLESMTAAQFYDWLDFMAGEPIGDQRADLRMATIAAAVMNAAGSKREFRPSNFMPEFHRPPQTAAQMADLLTAEAMAMRSHKR